MIVAIIEKTLSIPTINAESTKKELSENIKIAGIIINPKIQKDIARNFLIFFKP